MEKIIRLSENKLMVFYELPVVLVESRYSFLNTGNEYREVGIGVQKTKIRYKIAENSLTPYNIKSIFWKIVKEKYKGITSASYTSPSIDYHRENETIRFEDTLYSVNQVPKRIIIPASLDVIDKYIIENRASQIDSLL